MGRRFGTGTDGRSDVHGLVERLYEDITTAERVTQNTLELHEGLGGSGFRLPTRPLYAVLHEAIYCSGPGIQSNWAAQRVARQFRDAHYAWLHREFDFSFPDAKEREPLYFSGEMTYEFMLQDAGPQLQPLIEAGQVLAEWHQWSKLYDVEQLRKNRVHLRPLIYPDDMFVDFDLSQEVAGWIGNCDPAIAPEDWLHKSIKTRTEEVFKVLFEKETPK